MVAIATLALLLPADDAVGQAPPGRPAARGAMAARGTTDRATVDRMTAAWPERPKLGARVMMAKYGMPQEATMHQLVWHDAGPFKRISVLKLETPHDFPLPHVDFLEHTIHYNVPQDKVAALIEFDTSSTINRTVGELSARCDLEGHNVLTLNLDHDIVLGRKSVAEARKAFGDIVGEDVKGMHPPYVEALQFTPPAAGTTAFSDMPVIPGSPERANDTDTSARAALAKGRMAEAEMLATVVAIDLNEVGAAAEAQKKRLSQPVMDHAKMLHSAHGMSMEQTLKLGMQMGVTPIVTPAVEMLQKKGAGELAAFVRLDGHAFEHAYIGAMIKGHTEALAKLEQMRQAAGDATLKAHLAATHASVTQHLQKARALQPGLRSTASR